MKIRSYSWGAANLSWSNVIEELLCAAETAGHQVDFISTNGTAGMRRFNDATVISALASERAMAQTHTPYDLDLTFTVPNNFPDRFLKTSKVRLAITDYESHPAPADWRKWYHIPDRILPGSNWVAETLIAGGCPKEKLCVVPHGVDLAMFNPAVIPYPINTSKKFKFLCVAEPHYRKQIDVLLDVYCSTFTSADDVCLVLKTKLFKPGEERKPFEQDLQPILAGLVKSMGRTMPEIKIINERLPSIASLYTACQAFVLMTAAEGFGVPFLESLACGLPIIAPRFSGHLDFLSDENSILCDGGTRKARSVEQYWGQTPGSQVGNPSPKKFAAAMLNVYKNYEEVKTKLMPGMMATAQQFTWANAMNKIIDVAKSVRPDIEVV